MRLVDGEFLEVVRMTPLVAIDLVVVRGGNEVLLGLRNNRPAQGYWFVPGGRIRKDETLANACLRIAKFELGQDCESSDGALIGVFEHFYDDCFAGDVGVSTHYVVLAYRFDVGDDFVLGSHDLQHSKLQWWPVSAAMADDAVHANTRTYLTEIQKAQ